MKIIVILFLSLSSSMCSEGISSESGIEVTAQHRGQGGSFDELVNLILAKKEVPGDLLKKHTLIEPAMIDMGTFTGVRELSIKEGLKSYVVEYASPTCLQDLLLVYGQDDAPLANHTLREECDGEEGYEYWYQTYKVTGKDKVIITEVTVPEDGSKDIKEEYQVSLSSRGELIKVK